MHFNSLLGQKEISDILTNSITDKYLSYRAMELLEKMTESNNEISLPVERLATMDL
ncbi:hypothetical protein MO867_00415 [Microbulbifer sp. OS29]|uniref:Uncharacterized protein n=1 Tax=Microbulbifer okhotskensis TaxID=2926617 RepID=A0A9X2J2S1_9GAMM|nr:hypothetical protein [Microbulbifer okhotskensis]MCO1332787.1 hypothetical protein [Microbulbifer okhotskensis]